MLAAVQILRLARPKTVTGPLRNVASPFWGANPQEAHENKVINPWEKNQLPQNFARFFRFAVRGSARTGFAAAPRRRPDRGYEHRRLP